MDKGDPYLGFDTKTMFIGVLVRENQLGALAITLIPTVCLDFVHLAGHELNKAGYFKLAPPVKKVNILMSPFLHHNVHKNQ